MTLAGHRPPSGLETEALTSFKFLPPWGPGAMRRRKFILGSAAAALLPFAVRAQRGEPVRRVDFLIAEAIEGDPYYEGRVTGIREGLRKLGWIEGQNLRLNIHRTSPKGGDIRKSIEKLLAGQPDVVVTSGGTVAGPLLQATNTVPVVFIAAIDPLGAGYVEASRDPEEMRPALCSSTTA